MKNDDGGFQYVSHSVTPVQAYVNWKPGAKFWSPRKEMPQGKDLAFTYRSKLPALKGVTVIVHYELYNGIPALCKWLSIENNRGKSAIINQVVNEILATPEEESANKKAWP
jgi:hypothetical protein